MPRRLAVLLALLPAVASAAEPATVVVVGTEFVVRRADGTALGRNALLGAVLDVQDDAGRALKVRIDEILTDPLDPSREVVLYQMRTPAADGSWQELCTPDPNGGLWAFPLAAGAVDGAPGVFQVTCSSGAIGKCVRFGYKPWKLLPDGASLLDHHRACVWMVRADYCGDGTSFTEDGTLIDLYDRVGIQRSDAVAGMSFEAGWGPDGATCLAHPRIAGLASLEDIVRRCPAKLAGRVGAMCAEATAAAEPGTLLFNQSATP